MQSQWRTRFPVLRISADMNAMKLADTLRSLEKAAIDQEVQIAGRNAEIYELQTLLLAQNQSLAALQAEIVQCDQALAESRRLLTETMRRRQIDRSRFTTSLSWRMTFFIRFPALLINHVKKF